MSSYDKTMEIFKGIEAEVSFYFQPEEARTHDYPGCPEEHEITSVMVNGVDIAEHLTEEFLESLLQIVIEMDEPDYDAIYESRNDAARAKWENEN